ncbi:MAG: hypothetical protein E6K17_05535 [Methanobacteriota archaeon]|nr:MAG: hypothetical protein E6K17_05535 [Euryarchaeota archaeon]
MRGILITALAFVVAAAPALAAAGHLLGPPVVAHENEHEDHEHDNDCDEKDDHDADHDHDDGGEKDHDDDNEDDCAPAGGASRLIVESEILNGLGAGALYPFVDTTPHNITSAHIAITDATESCVAGASAPQNIHVLVGVAGGTLADVMDATTNTGIGNSGQCVFHLTIVPGQNGVPAQVTDIVVKNASESPLTGQNTITVSAEVA